MFHRLAIDRTRPHGTLHACSLAVSSSTVIANDSSIAAFSAGRFATRSVLVLNRGSSADRGADGFAQPDPQAGAAAATMMMPSFARNGLYGAIVK